MHLPLVFTLSPAVIFPADGRSTRHVSSFAVTPPDFSGVALERLLWAPKPLDSYKKMSVGWRWWGFVAGYGRSDSASSGSITVNVFFLPFISPSLFLPGLYRQQFFQIRNYFLIQLFHHADHSDWLFVVSLR